MGTRVTLAISDLIKGSGVPNYMGCRIPVILLPESVPGNHRGALDYPDQVQTYIDSETSKGAILGPFKTNSLNGPLALSPLNTTPKRDSEMSYQWV